MKLKTCLSIIPLVYLVGFLPLAEAQRTEAAKPKGSTKVSGSMEQKTSVPLPLPEIQMGSCKAGISFEFHQRDTLARVVSTIEYEPCPISRGEYELLISVNDGNGDHQTLKFDESWGLEDDSLVEFSKDYPIGENVTLTRVMARGLRCECPEP
jgi:hypothetical protein